MTEVAETIAHDGPGPLEVWFEPWARVHTLQPGESFRVVATPEEPGSLEIDRDGSRAAVWAWPGATLRIYRGEHLVDDMAIKVPALPPGKTTRSFLHLLFGGPGGPNRP